MALRDQPYFPFYVKDYLTDEKLNLCSLEAQGVFVKIMCVLHKQNEYGTLLLKQNDKQNSSTYSNFAYKFAKLLPIPFDILKSAINELIDEGVLIIDGDKIFQKRMVKDNKISILRSEAGSRGGKKTQSFAKADTKADTKASAAYAIETVNENVSSNVNDIYNEWNFKKIIVHKKFTNEIRNKIKTKLKDYSVGDIRMAISNYDVILRGDYYFKYKWTLRDFLQKGLDKFLNLEIAKNNYKSKPIQKTNNRGTRRQAVTLSEEDKEQYR